MIKIGKKLLGFRNIQENVEKVIIFSTFQVGAQGFLTWLALAETKSPDRATLMLTFIGPSTQQQIALVLRQSPSVGSVITLSNYKGTQ